MTRLLTMLFTLLTPLLSIAQSSGRIEGHVRTADGIAVREVRVTVFSDALISRSLTFATSKRGAFRFAILPPGKYDLTFEKTGFRSGRLEGLQLSAGSVLTVDYVVTTEETPAGAAPGMPRHPIDKKSSALTYTLDSGELNSLPRSMDIWSRAELAPAYNTGSALGGVAGAGNSCGIDGVNVSDTVSGAVFCPISLEAASQLELVAFGGQAVRGAFIGAAINVVTRSGGNDFHGEVNYFARQRDWQGDNTAEYRQLGIGETAASSLNAPTVAVGGPLQREKLWFFSSYAYSISGTRRGLLDGAVTESHRPQSAFVKLSRSWGARQTTIAGWNRSRSERTHWPAYGDWSVNLEGSLGRQASSSDVYLLQHTIAFGDDFYLEGRFSGFRGGFELLPRVHGPTRRDVTSGYRHVAPGSLGREDQQRRSRQGILLAADYFIDDLSGGHGIKFGFEWERSLGAGSYSHRDNEYYRYGRPWRLYDHGSYEGGGVIERFAGFLHDSWSLNQRLTVNIGFRIDSSGMSAESPEQAPAGRGTFLRFTDPAFRIGAAYDAFGDGSTVLRGFLGRYYEGLVTGNTEPMVIAVPPTRLYSWTGTDWRYESSSGGADPGAFMINPDISNQFTEGLMVGLERSIGRSTTASVHFVYKWDQNLLGAVFPHRSWTEKQLSFSNGNGSFTGAYFGDLDTRNPQVYTNPRKGDNGVLGDLYRHYWCVALEVKRRMGDRWSLSAGYTYSRNTGTVQNLDPEIIKGNIDYGNPNLWINAGGRLSADRPHVFKLSGTFFAPPDISFTPIVIYRDGTPRPVLYNPEESFLVKPTDGEERHHSQLLVDMRLEKTFRLGERYRLGVILDAFNILNNDAVTSYASYDIASDQYLVPAAIVEPRSFQLGARFLF